MVSTLMVNIKHTIIPVLHLPIRMMSLTPLHSERQKLCRVLAVLSAKGFKKKSYDCSIRQLSLPGNASKCSISKQKNRARLFKTNDVVS